LGFQFPADTCYLREEEKELSICERETRSETCLSTPSTFSPSSDFSHSHPHRRWICN
jgi:hypothetical protein